MNCLSLFFWQKVFAHTIPLELHAIVNLLFAKEKKSNNPKLSVIEKHKIAWVINICCICVALGFTSRDYWGIIFEQNSLTYLEISVDPEDLKSSHNSLCLGKKTQQTTKIFFPLKILEENTVYFS